MPTDEQQRIRAIRHQNNAVLVNLQAVARQIITSFTSPPTSQRVCMSPPGPSNVPAFSYFVDPADGQMKSRINVTDGLGFGGSLKSDGSGGSVHEPNSMPRVASPAENNGYTFGGNFSGDLAQVTPHVVEAIQTAPTRTLDFIALDPTESRMNRDTAGKRGASSVAIFPG